MSDLKTLKKVLTPKTDKYHIGVVVGRKKGTRIVELENSARRTVWGSADIGKNVVILRNQIIGEIGAESMATISID